MQDRKFLLIAWLCTVILLFTSCAIFDLQLQPSRAIQRTATEKFLSAIDSSSRAQTSLQTSPDGRQIAYIRAAGQKELVVTNRKDGEAYDEIRSFPTFSPDSKRIAYIARPSFLKDLVVIDGKAEKRYDAVDLPLTFSPDSQRFAYIARTDDHHTVVVFDGKESRVYEYISSMSLGFSPDSHHLVYAASENNKWFVVRDGKEGDRYDNIGNYLNFSPDSQHLAYSVSIGNQWFVLIDGKREGPYDQRIDHIFFSPNSQRHAYVVHANNRWTVIIDGKAQADYEELNFGPVFSEDSQHLVYVAQNGRDPLGTKFFVVVDGRESKPYQGIRLVWLSQNADRIIFIGGIGNKLLATYTPIPTVQGQAARAFALPMVPQYVIVVNGKELGPYYFKDMGDLNVPSPTDLGIAYLKNPRLLFAVFPVSPDGIRLAFAAREDYVKLQPQFVVLDGVEGKRYDEIIIGTSLFSSNSKRFVYGARNVNQQFMVLDGKESKPYDIIWRGTTVFSPDSRHIAYVAQSEKSRFVVVDDTEGNAFDEIYVGENSNRTVIDTRKRIIFDSADSFHYLARRGNEIYLVEEKLY